MASSELGVNTAGRPYPLHPADDGREFRSELLPMPSMEELMASLETLSKEEIMTLAYARGASTGYTRGLEQRDRLIGELVFMNFLGLRDLRLVTALSDGHLRKILRDQDIPAEEPDRSGPRIRRAR